MKKNKSNEKGITLISVSITVVILLILSATLVYNSRNSIELRNLENMYNDIELLKDKVSLYYIKNGTIPANVEYSNIQMLKNAGVIGENDNNKYYIIDLKAMNGISLTYGKDYKNIQAETNIENADYRDIYIINEQSHNIYYVKGIKANDKIYYTDNSDNVEINLQNS